MLEINLCIILHVRFVDLQYYSIQEVTYYTHDHYTNYYVTKTLYTCNRMFAGNLVGTTRTGVIPFADEATKLHSVVVRLSQN